MESRGCSGTFYVFSLAENALRETAPTFVPQRSSQSNTHPARHTRTARVRTARPWILKVLARAWRAAGSNVPRPSVRRCSTGRCAATAGGLRHSRWQLAPRVAKRSETSVSGGDPHGLWGCAALRGPRRSGLQAQLWSPERPPCVSARPPRAVGGQPCRCRDDALHHA